MNSGNEAKTGKRSKTKRVGCVLGSWIVSVLIFIRILSPAIAQTAKPPVTPDPRRTIPEQIEPQNPQDQSDPESPGTLSERLRENQGVIEPPPGSDPGIEAPAPDPTPGTTPVIPPSAVEPETPN